MLDDAIPKQDAAMPLSENADTPIRRYADSFPRADTPIRRLVSPGRNRTCCWNVCADGPEQASFDL